MTRLTDQEFWERRWRSRPDAGRREEVHPWTMPFHPILQRVLPRGGSFVEVGCAPGRNMVYFSRYFGYQVAGIDFVAEEFTRRTLEANHVEDYELYRMDFLEELPPRKFDVVASFGFVEHFTRLAEVIARHVALVNPGGHVVIGAPNLLGAQRLIRLVLDRAALRRHNPEAMKCPVLRGILTDLGAREIVYCGHYRTFKLWLGPEGVSPALVRAAALFDACFQRLARLLRVDNIPNRFFSPYVLTIAKF